MVSLNGDTQRVPPVRLRPDPVDLPQGGRAEPVPHPELELAPAERVLALHLDAFADTLVAAADEYEPHKVAAYLYELASHYTTFYDECPVLKAEHHGADARTGCSCAS